MADGLLADYGVDTSDVEVPNFEVEDGFYNFEIGDVFVKEGSDNFPDAKWLIIEYLLEDDDENSKGKTSDLFTLPVDPDNPTADEKTKLGFYVKRILELGFERADVNGVTRDDLVGLRGTLQVYTSAGKGKNKGKSFQNIKNVKLHEADDAPAVEAKPAVTRRPAGTTAAKTAPKQTAAKNPFAKQQ